MRLRKVVTTALVLATVAVSTSSAGATATVTVGKWEMNERPWASVMVDSSGRRHDGAIGGSVVLATVTDGATGYKWPFTSPTALPVKPARLVVVPGSVFNPGTDDYAVTIRFRSTQRFGNIIQKGQAGSSGGYFKVQMPQGVVSCLFRGEAGSRSVNSGIALNDGRWHTVRCERTADRVVMTIDGTRTRRALGATGRISNSVDLVIGGKSNCDNVKVTCDYFTGEIDRVVIEKNPG